MTVVLQRPMRVELWPFQSDLSSYPLVNGRDSTFCGCLDIYFFQCLLLTESPMIFPPVGSVLLSLAFLIGVLLFLGWADLWSETGQMEGENLDLNLSLHVAWSIVCVATFCLSTS